jgi:hypothetical protein
MNDKEMAKIQVADECAETREEDLGYQMVRHYNYLSSLNHEWSSLCELAVKMYLPNKKYIEKIEQQLKEAESVIELYCHHDDVFGSHGFDISCEACTERPLGKRARQYLAKYKTNE